MLIQIPGFLGGQVDSAYEPVENQTFQKARDLDIFGELNVLTPNHKLVNDNGKSTNFKPYNSYTGSDGKHYFLGQEEIAATTYRIVYSTALLGTLGTYTEVDKVSGTIGNEYPFEEFKDGLFWGNGTSLRRWGNLSGAPSAANVAGISLTTSLNALRSHIGLGKLFYVHNTQKSIGWYNGSTNSDSVLVLNANDRIVSIEPFGQFLLVGVKDVQRSKNSRILIWDGASSTVEDVMELSTPNLQAFRVIGSMIRALVADNREWAIYEGTVGGQLDPVCIFKNVNSDTTTEFNNEALSVNTGVLYWGTKAAQSVNTPTLSQDVGVFAYGTEKISKPKRLNLDRLVHTGATTAVAITSVKYNGRFYIVTWTNGTDWFINHNNDSSRASSANGVYQTEIFKTAFGRKGKIKEIIIDHKSLPASTGFTVKIRHLGSKSPMRGIAPGTEETFASGAVSVSQTLDNTTRTVIKDGDVDFKYCEAAQIQIAFDTVSGTNAPEIIFPIIIETEEKDIN